MRRSWSAAIVLLGAACFVLLSAVPPSGSAVMAMEDSSVSTSTFADNGDFDYTRHLLEVRELRTRGDRVKQAKTRSKKLVAKEKKEANEGLKRLKAKLAKKRKSKSSRRPVKIDKKALRLAKRVKRQARWEARQWSKGEEEIEACASDAFSSSESEAEAIHIDAVVLAHATACDPAWDGNTKDLESIYLAGDAYAIAGVTAIAAVSCAPTGKGPRVCDTADAAAYAIAKSMSSIHAKAVASALSGCNCKVQAQVDAYADVSYYLDLIAEASASAEVEVCSKARKQVTEYAYQQCTAKAFGKVFAEATAKAIVAGECSNAALVSQALAEIGGKWTETLTCTAGSGTLRRLLGIDE